MPFNVEYYISCIDNSFQQGGAQDFREFIGRHAGSARWIVASDYNTGSKGSDHDVYSFALYPTSHGIDSLCETLRTCFPRDFKETNSITRDQKRFFKQDICYCFIFLISNRSKFLRSGDRETDILVARESLKTMVNDVQANGTDEFFIKQLKRLLNESHKTNFNLYLYERILILSMLNAYVASKIATNTPVEILAWFPDRDDMTIYQNSVFNALTHINFVGLWRKIYPNKISPRVRTIDRRIRNAPLDDMVDELIRVPDFFSAVLSRWRITRNVLSAPDGAKRAARRRYIHIMKHWLAENNNIWVANCRLDGDELNIGRMVTAKSPKRLEKIINAKNHR